jgi:hypothetical protein
MEISESILDLGWNVADSRKRRRKSNITAETITGIDREIAGERRQLAAVSPFSLSPSQPINGRLYN